MKKLLFLLFVSLLGIMNSCDKDNGPDVIRYELISNTPGAPIWVECDGIYVKDYWVLDYQLPDGTDPYFVPPFHARCSDPYVLMTVRIYLNGKLMGTQEGNNRVSIKLVR